MTWNGDLHQDINETNTVLNPPDDPEMYVRLAHFSVKEYLVSDRIQQSMVMHYSVQEIASHGVLAEDCTAYLLNFDKAVSLFDGTSIQYPLLEYAAESWASHAKQAERKRIESTSRMVERFLLSDGELLSNWIRIANPDYYQLSENVGMTSDNIALPLYYASYLGLFESVRMLIQKGINVKTQGKCFGNALRGAALSGHGEIVKLLLENKADTNAQGGYCGNALQAASVS